MKLERNRRYGDLKGDRDFKLQFLDNMRNIDKNAEGTVKSAEIILRRFGNKEEELKKDLYDFTVKELSDTLITFRLSSSGDASRVSSVLKKYLLFAHSKMLGNLSLNMDVFLNKEQSDAYIWPNREKSKIFLEEQIKDISKLIYNARDKLGVWLLWLGIKGYKFNDIRMLKKKDVDMGKRFIVPRDDRIVENVPQFIIDLIDETNNMDDYYVYDTEGHIKDIPTTLKDNDFLLRPIDGPKGKMTADFINVSTFRQTYTCIKKSFLERYPGFSPLNIYKSGILDRFYKYVEKNNIKLHFVYEEDKKFLKGYLNNNNLHEDCKKLYNLFKSKYEKL